MVRIVQGRGWGIVLPLGLASLLGCWLAGLVKEMGGLEIKRRVDGKGM